jgi:hemerythrin superfamily protein
MQRDRHKWMRQTGPHLSMIGHRFFEHMKNVRMSEKYLELLEPGFNWKKGSQRIHWDKFYRANVRNGI